MNTEDFLRLCEEKVIEYYKNTSIFNSLVIEKTLKIYKVWYSKTLQNHKCCMSTSNDDFLYFEFTYNGDKKQLYMDVYDKLENKCYEI